MYKAKKVILSFYLLLIVGLGLISIILFTEFQSVNLKFYVFDIGQGDAILIRTPVRQNILIDGGPDNKVIYKLGQYLPFYDREIDLMILTHPHADHVVGLVEVLERYKVEKVLTTGVRYGSPAYLVWLDLLVEKNIAVEIIDQPRKMFLAGGVELDILFPDRSFLDQEIENLNNTSIVAKLTYQDVSIMLTGDFEDEEYLIEKELDLSADILKVGHHGSDTANNLEFLEAVDSNIAVISCGQDNKFDHPHQETVDNLQSLGIEIFRTDQQGDFYWLKK